LLTFSTRARRRSTNCTPGWLVAGAWIYVALRVVHSYIHCTDNRVMHRFFAFAAGSMPLVALWAAFVIQLAGGGAS
jgi:hypothetical protein